MKDNGENTKGGAPESENQSNTKRLTKQTQKEKESRNGIRIESDNDNRNGSL
jgi:hypothetical protein